jgi:hypothetical protein
VSGHPVPRADHPRGLLTLWRCPFDGWGGYWHDLARRAEDVGGTGPPLDTLPGDAEDDEPEEAVIGVEAAPDEPVGRRRLWRRD